MTQLNKCIVQQMFISVT